MNTYLSFKQVQDEFEKRGRPRPSRTHLWRLAKRGAFPAPRKFGGHQTGYVESEIVNWLDNPPAADWAKNTATEAA